MQTFFLVAVVLLGACVGSFLNVVIYRVPAGTFFSGGNRSHCPKCDAPILWFDNIPVFSWVVLLRGKARCCGARISARYPFVEGLTAALFGMLFWLTVSPYVPVEVTPDVVGPSGQVWLKFGFQSWLLAVLIACTFIDIDHRILPNVLTKPTMFVGCVGALIVPGLAGSFDHPPTAVMSFWYTVVGAIAGFGFTASIRALASTVFGREAMGFGDVKFMGAIGAFVGWEGALMTFFIGSLAGALYGGLHQWITKEAQIFFGPFLALGALITLFWRAPILHFATVTWPEWQHTAEVPPWALLGIAGICALLLVGLVRRGRRRR